MTADPRKHPNVEILDSYADGDHSCLDVDQHVRGCAECREAVEAVRQVRVDLAGLASVTMPADVALRIQAALDAAHTPHAAHTSHLGGADADADAGPADDELPRPGAGRPPRRARATGRPRRRGLRVVFRPDLVTLTAACLVAVVVLAGVFAARRGNHENSTAASIGTEASGSEAGRAESSAARDTANGADAAAPESGAADGYATAEPNGPGGPVATAAPPAAAGGRVALTTSDTPVDERDLARHANDILAGRVEAGWLVELYAADPLGPPPAPSPVASPTPPATRQDSGDAVDRWRQLVNPTLVTCYRSLSTQTGGEVIAIDRVRYDGRVGVFVALSVPGSPESVHVFVIDINCGMIDNPMAQWEDQIVARS